MSRSRLSGAGALLLCLLGAGILFVPWAHATVVYFDPGQKPQADGVYQARRFSSEVYAGYRFWHGITAGGVFLGLFLFLRAC